MTKSPVCSRCHRPLKDPLSIALGMGPDCRGALSRKGWTFPKPKWKVQGGRAVFLGVDGKVQPPPTNVTDDDEDDDHEPDNEHEDQDPAG